MKKPAIFTIATISISLIGVCGIFAYKYFGEDKSNSQKTPTQNQSNGTSSQNFSQKSGKKAPYGSYSSNDADSSENVKTSSSFREFFESFIPQDTSAYSEWYKLPFFEQIYKFVTAEDPLHSFFGRLPPRKLTKSQKLSHEYIQSKNEELFDDFNTRITEWVDLNEQKLVEEIKKAENYRSTSEEKRESLDMLLSRKLKPNRLLHLFTKFNEKYHNKWNKLEISVTNLLFLVSESEYFIKFINDFEKDEFFSLRKGIVYSLNLIQFITLYDINQDWLDGVLIELGEKIDKFLKKYKMEFANRNWLNDFCCAFFNLHDLSDFFVYKFQTSRPSQYRQVFDGLFLPVFRFSDLKRGAFNSGNIETIYSKIPHILLFKITDNDPRTVKDLFSIIRVNNECFNLISIHQKNGEIISSYFPRDRQDPLNNSFFTFENGNYIILDNPEMDQIFRKDPNKTFLVVYEQEFSDAD